MTGYLPWKVLHLDLSQAIPDLVITPEYQGMYLVFWWKSIPLGHRELLSDELPMPASQVANLAAQTITPAVGRHWLKQGYIPGFWHNPKKPDPEQAPPLLAELLAVEHPLTALPVHLSSLEKQETVSVVICTRDRPEALKRCLQSIVQLSAQPDEIVVVDNATTTGATRDLVAQIPQVRYILEPQPGLSHARNAGARHSTGDIIAFTDDDVEVHPDWIAQLRLGFAEPEAMVVTGLVLASELETESQWQFERFWSFNRGYRCKIFDRTFFEQTRSRGVPVDFIGAGANMACRRTAFEQIGLFDVRLGAGASGCSEDTEFWYRVLAAGKSCIYQPTAIVHHTHRADLFNLNRQIKAYMRGYITSYLIQAQQHGHWGNLYYVFFTLPTYYLRRILVGLVIGFQPGDKTLATEITGYLSGFSYYLRHCLFSAFRNVASQTSLAPDSPTSNDPPTSIETYGHPATSLATPVNHKQRLSRFLAQNPFPHPLTQGFFYREKMAAIHQISPDFPFQSILEVGGGPSGLTAMLYPHAHVTNLDLNPYFASAPCNQQPQVKFVCGDATALPFPDKFFDALTMFDVLEHIPDDKKAINEAKRVLKPGGFLLISTPNEHWRFPYYDFMKPFCPRDVDVMAEWGHVRYGYTLGELKELIELPYQDYATFINPITAIGHDVAFSRLSPLKRQFLCSLLSPLTWFGYLIHKPHSIGTETASIWHILK